MIPEPNIRRLRLPKPPARIDLVPIGPLDDGGLDPLAAELASRFGVPVLRGQPLALRSEWCDASRGQLQADAILDALIARRSDDEWLLGVVDGDLFIPGLNFIFGQATVGGCCAVIGLARLRETFYGRPEPDAERFRRRTLIEAVHELGHVAGLDHCPEPSCVMHFSETIEDTDRKGPDFCPRCAP
ncbi:MAG TPA: archaemetzincin family Zn-dependent metalloprotease [Longimicrobiales bacterium]